MQQQERKGGREPERRRGSWVLKVAVQAKRSEHRMPPVGVDRLERFVCLPSVADAGFADKVRGFWVLVEAERGGFSFHAQPSSLTCHKVASIKVEQSEGKASNPLPSEGGGVQNFFYCFAALTYDCYPVGRVVCRDRSWCGGAEVSV